MKVMVIVKASASSEAGEMPSQELLTAMGNYNEKLVKAGIMLAGEGLHPSANGARVLFSGTKRLVTDGPFAETKELIAGFWLWKVKSMEEAIEWVKQCPNPMQEDSEIEIRQVFEADDFGEEFTPELREQEANIRAQSLGLGEIRFENQRDLLISGLNASYTPQTRQNIPAQWEEFAPSMGKVPGQVGHDSYGVCWKATPDGKFDYLTGVEVSTAFQRPAEFVELRLDPQRYAVFTHTAHISSFPNTIDTIWTKWVPDCGLTLADAPCVERYTEEFDPKTGYGGTEIWIPLASKE